MADVKGKTYGTGLFERLDSSDAKSNPLTYKLTPKIADPFAPDVDRKMAKFIISDALIQRIREVKGAVTTTSANKASREDPSSILGKLSNPDRGYFDFFMQSVEESFDDKFQIVETLGDSYAVFGLGKKPKAWNYSGVLLNTVENDWRVNFIRMFEDYIGISSLSKLRKANLRNVVTLVYDSVIAEGAILRLRTSMAAGNEMSSPFAFTMLVTKLTTINPSKLDGSSVREPSQAILSEPETKNVAAVPQDTPEQYLALKKWTSTQTRVRST